MKSLRFSKIKTKSFSGSILLQQMILQLPLLLIAIADFVKLTLSNSWLIHNLISIANSMKTSMYRCYHIGSILRINYHSWQNPSASQQSISHTQIVRFNVRYLFVLRLFKPLVSIRWILLALPRDSSQLRECANLHEPFKLWTISIAKLVIESCCLISF